MKTFEDLRERITGGGEEGTKFVKGLDRKLLRASRRGEAGENEDGGEPKGDTVVDEEAELDELERKEVAPAPKSATVKKGEMAPPPAPSESKAPKRSRDEIMAELRAQRKAAASAQATKKSELGARFKKFGATGSTDKRPYPRIERDDKGREVLITMDASGKIKRKVRKAPEPSGKKGEDGTSHGLPMPDRDAKPLGMEVPEDLRNGAADEGEEDDDIFQGVGDAYDPLKDEALESDGTTSSSDSDEPKTKPAPPQPRTASPSKEQEHELSTQPDKPNERSHNYFNTPTTESTDTASSNNKPAFSDPTILATLKRAAALRQTSAANNRTRGSESGSGSGSDDDSALPARPDGGSSAKTGSTAEERIRARMADDRDWEDMDMEFGGSRLGDGEEEGGGKVKLSEWKGVGAGEDAGAGKGGGKGKGKKEGSRRKKKGDKDNVADLMRVIEGRKGGK